MQMRDWLLLYALWKWLHKEETKPVERDLSKYVPKKRLL